MVYSMNGVCGVYHCTSHTARPVPSLVPSSSQVLFGTGNAKVKIYDILKKQSVHEIDVPATCPRVLDIVSSPVDELFVTACAGKNHDSLEGGKGVLEAWSMQTGQRIKTFMIEASRTQTNSLMFNHNGNMLVTGGADGMIRVFDMQTSQALMGWPAHEGQVSCVRFSADETSVFSCGLDGKIIQWSLHRIGRKEASYQILDQDSFTSWPVTRCELALSPDTSHFLASGSAARPVGFLYSLADRQSIMASGGPSTSGASGATSTLPSQVISGHSDAVLSVDWHPTKNLCLTGSADSTLRMTSLSFDSEASDSS